MWGEVQRAAGAMERLVELRARSRAIVAPPQPVELPRRARPNPLRPRDVPLSFAPRDRGARRLHRSTIEPGETVAFVGPSGAGKSTTFQLLLRFYDPGAGACCSTASTSRTRDPRTCARAIGLVPQETVLFGASARENIRYGRPGASDAEIEAAARAAGPTSSSARCRRATTRSSASAARGSPAASGSASRSRARS